MTRSRRLLCQWIGGSLACALMLLGGCAGSEPRTPLPAQVNVVSPGPEIPERVAAFSGIWVGRVETITTGMGTGRIGRDQTLVVQRISQAGDALTGKPRGSGLGLL